MTFQVTRDNRRSVTRLRHHIQANRRWAAALIALALLAKLLVPAGFMPSVEAGRITVELCSGYGVQKVEMALPGVADRQPMQGEHGKAESPCTFAGVELRRDKRGLGIKEKK